jgi:HNH endonuclease
VNISQLEDVSSVDVYFICQMIDNIAREPFPYLRNIEDIFGDASSQALTRSYPKFTALHVFIEEVISSVIWEKASSRMETLENGLWVDHLFEANNINMDFDEWRGGVAFGCSIGEYLTFLSEEGFIDQVCEKVSKQVFYILFSNRKTLSSFSSMIRGYVLNAAPSFSPEKFAANGRLKRTRIPSWARGAVFHRDKGRCVLCKTDLTRLFSQKEKIHYDHIVPLALGGMNCVTNLQLTCENCNLRKGSRNTDTSFEYEVWYNY